MATKRDHYKNGGTSSVSSHFNLFVTADARLIRQLPEDISHYESVARENPKQQTDMVYVQLMLSRADRQSKSVIVSGHKR